MCLLRGFGLDRHGQRLLVVVQGGAAAAGWGVEEAEQGGFALQPGAFVFHVEKVPGVVDGDEVAVVEV